MSSLDYLDLCRLCLVKDCVSTPIFGGEGDVRQIFLKIAACLPVKVAKEDKLPKKICNDCVYKVELCYDFWNTTANSEKQLLQWLGGSASETKQNYASDGRSSQSVLKSEGSSGNRLGGPAINNMGIGIMDNIGLGVPMMISSNNQQQISSVPMDTSSNSVQTSQAVPGPSSQTARENAANPTTQDEEEISTEDEENSDDDNDAEGLPVKEESEEDANSSRNIEPTTFVNVSLACDEAGPSGLQRQKIAEIPEMTIPQTVEGDPKSGKGSFGSRILKVDPLGQFIVGKNAVPMKLCQQTDADGITSYALVPVETMQQEVALISESYIKIEKYDDFKRSDIDFPVTTSCYLCEKCDIKFPMKSMLRRHKISHTLRHQFMSKFVETKQPCRTFKTHDKNFTKIHKYSPKFSNYSSKREIVLKEHSIKKRQKDNIEKSTARLKDVTKFTKFRCMHCDFQCNRSITLSSHIARYHRKSDEDTDSKGSLRKGVKDTNTERRVNKCADERVNPLCKKKIALNVEQKTNIKVEEEFCDICEFKCSKKSTLSLHKRRHKLENESEVLSCNECGYKTCNRSSLYSHIKRKHKTGKSLSDDQPELFYCNQCDYKNKNKYELKVHVIRKHTDDFKFSCETCGKKFKVKGDLTNHIRFSHREQPVICDVCGKTCLNSNSLYVHQKFAHYKAKYECQVCKRRMVSQENLNEHMLRQHERRENVVCEECGKTFSRNSRLKVHMRVHTGDKPYNCKICNKAFARRTALKQHLLIHTGIRPYVCDICGKAFTQKPGLISHRKSHPGSHPPLPRVLIDHILNDVMNT
ncbi:zinc finger protein 676-like isoform X1 [Prorops nasuta]|uniref:zinc finger protein 676-like isoform X1 n=1 Tax=Prorops nasuta TaxID=863751 RepID=UPI0034CDF3B0